MVYNPATDFLGLWRLVAGQVSKVEMPGLDYVVAALARAGLITLSVSATQPVANQSTTAWLQTAVPSNSAEGVLRLWNPATSAYVAATQALLFRMLETAAGQSGVSWYTCVAGPPSNVTGLDGDFAIRTDAPNGIYGPKVLGVWPANPIPGTADVVTSVSLDNTFGATPGQLIYRGALNWQALAIGGANQILSSAGGFPAWAVFSTLLDTLFGNLQGSILYRDVGAWATLPPGVANQVLASGGPAANPAWAPRTSEFPSGTVMLFQQTAAPPFWTKQVTLNDYGLRVVNGAVSTTPGSAFSTVFSQSVVGNHTVSVAEMPAHGHSYILASASGAQKPLGVGSAPLDTTGGSTTGSIGGGGAHNHSVNLTLSYVDVIIASKN